MDQLSFSEDEQEELVNSSNDDVVDDDDDGDYNEADSDVDEEGKAFNTKDKTGHEMEVKVKCRAKRKCYQLI